MGERKLAEFLVRNGQVLLPMLELIEQSRVAIDELIDVMGSTSIEPVLQLSAREVAGRRSAARQVVGRWFGTAGRRAACARACRETNKLRRPR